ncbi:EAL and HDOD domain-containing protein [Thiomicrorhabdus sediminis]|uniref:EAL domain-containing protein n=1 Tax=Thiomicrorhabdus sediminis TaxID=2580412 RepID=A0A4P9K6Z6_9GAMM|nr:EAL domain-containing protein [Thiomicrorhabdus sediminis]QCU90874.1 EAL domain-containing protein [Thiomicrorhabdus sediminis]
MSEVFIGRQPILDRDMKVFAYELQFHTGLNPNKETIEATEELIKKTDENIGFKAIVGQHAAMLHLPKALIDKSKIPEFNPEQEIVLEIPNNITKDVELLRHLKELKAEGSSIALDDFVEEDASLRLATISDYIKVNIEQFSELKLKKIIEDMHEKGIKVIAEKVETEEMFNYLRKIGFDYFQGYFFTNPVVINGQTLSGNKLTLLQLLAKVNNPNTDFDELSSIISQDVGLSHKLLIAINNPATMIPVKVEKVSDALKYMGLKRLKFWVNMLMLSSMENIPQELITTSLMRAKFCELLAESIGQQSHKDSYFLVGLFSNLSAFFKVPVEEIVNEIPVADDIKEALIHKTGKMGEALKVLNSMESANTTLTNVEYEGMGIGSLGNNFMAANAWAQTVMKS